MKSIVSLLSIIALGLGILSCSGGGGGGTETASGSFTRVALVPNQTDNTVSVFLVDNAAGRLRPRGYVVSGTSPRAVAVHPSGKFFYTINGGPDNNVSAYVLSVTGLATAVTGSPFSLALPPASASGPTAVAVSPDGQFLFVANQSSMIGSVLSVFSITQTTGELTPISGSPFPLVTATGPTAIAVHPSGNLLFVTNTTPATLFVFRIGPDGSLSRIGPTGSLLPDPKALALNATGTLVYVANNGSNSIPSIPANDSISAFQVNPINGDLTQISGSPLRVAPGTAPSSVAVGPGGQFLYVANSGTGTIGLFAIDQVTGALILRSPIPMISTGAKPQFISIDPDGRTLYATDSTLKLVDFFSIDSVTGQLTPAGTRAMRAGPGALAFASGTAPVTPTPTFAYVANTGGNNVSAFSITASTGLLTELVGVGSPFSVAPGTGPVALSADPLGKFAFVGNSGTNDLSAFSINGTAGSLTGIAGSPFPLAPGTNPQSVATDPSGGHLYVANQGSNNVSAFSIASGTGNLTTVTGSPFSTGGTGPRAVTVEPSGRFAYVVNATTNQVSLFPIDQTNGALMGTGVLFPLAANAAPQAIVADPTGRFLYVANKGTNKVSAYLIAAANGSLAELISLGSPFPVAPGIGPVSLSVDPLGQFLYVANETSQNVSAFAIDQATGALSVIGSLVSTTSPQSIAVDLSGQFVYVANASGTVTAFAINQTSGTLGPLSVAGSPFAAGLNPSAITTVGRF